MWKLGHINGIMAFVLPIIVLTFSMRYFVGRNKIGSIKAKIRYPKRRMFLTFGIIYFVMGFTQVFAGDFVSTEELDIVFIRGILNILYAIMWTTLYSTGHTYIGSKGIIPFGLTAFIREKQIAGYRLNNGWLTIKKNTNRSVHIQYEIKDEESLKSAMNEIVSLNV